MSFSLKGQGPLPSWPGHNDGSLIWGPFSPWGGGGGEGSGDLQMTRRSFFVIFFKRNNLEHLRVQSQ